MRKAFTMLEVIVVIVLIGILSVAVMPQFQRDQVAEAAHQVINHIRYTQHLAMVEDQFDPNDVDWYKERWQIFFANTNGSDNQWAYTVFSDSAGLSTGTPDISEMAPNPQDSSKLLTGGYSAGTVPYNDDQGRDTKEMNLGNEYGITEISFAGECSDGSLRIAFDHMGRPLFGNSRYLDAPYARGGNTRLIRFDDNGDPCIITLSDSSDSIDIAVIPETGYACMWDNANNSCI